MTFKSHNRQIDAYKQDRPLKKHELRMKTLLQEELGAFDGRFLDIGCATGSFLGHVQVLFPEAELHGLEYSDELISIGKQELYGTGIKLIEGDAAAFKPKAPYDAILASGILGIFEDPYPVLEIWLSWLSERGKLFIFSAFNSNHVDVVIRYRNHYQDQGWESGFSWFSLKGIRAFFEENGYKTRMERFKLDVDLPKNENPIRQHTVKLEDGERLLVNGANLIFEQYFLVVEKIPA